MGGWGLNGDGDDTNDNQLKSGELKVIYNRDCNQEWTTRFPEYKGIPLDTLCAVGKGVYF